MRRAAFRAISGRAWHYVLRVFLTSAWLRMSATTPYWSGLSRRYLRTGTQPLSEFDSTMIV